MRSHVGTSLSETRNAAKVFWSANLLSRPRGNLPSKARVAVLHCVDGPTLPLDQSLCGPLCVVENADLFDGSEVSREFGR